MKFVGKAIFAVTPVVAEDDILFPEKKVSLPRFVLDLKNWIKFQGNSNMFGSITDVLFKNAPEGEPSSQQTVLSLFRPQTWK